MINIQDQLTNIRALESLQSELRYTGLQTKKLLQINGVAFLR
jgi:hypothetical protein